MKAGPIARSAPGILVVDDNEDMLESMRMVLERAGYEVDTASSGERAVLLQRERPADVLITDIFMPDTSGMELIGQFKHEFPAVRIIAMSVDAGQIERDYLADTTLIGADETLRKPFEPEKLRQTLHRLLHA